MTDDGRADELRLLEQRARRLAQRTRTRDLTAVRPLLRFRVDQQRYAVDARLVLEVARASRISPLPGATHGWIGLAPWRGQVIGVKDVHAARAAEERWRQPAHLVVLEAQPAFALFASAVHEILEVPETELHTVAAEQARYGAWADAVLADATIVLGLERMLDR